MLLPGCAHICVSLRKGTPRPWTISSGNPPRNSASNHKKVFFRSGWAHYETAQQGSLRLSPTPDRLKPLEADYDKMQEMFFGDRPAFAQVLQVIRDWESGFNQTSTKNPTT
jgi:hypothetical protein